MNQQGFNPREFRRAGEEGAAHRSGGARRAGDTGAADAADYVLGADGRPLVDRFGRPVRRRPTGARPAADDATRVDRPTSTPTPRSRESRQYIPPREPRAASASTAAAQPAQPGGYVPRQRPAASASTAGAQAPRRNYGVGGAGTPRKRPHRRAKKVHPAKVIGGWFTAIVAALLVFTVVFVLWTDTRLSRTDALGYEHVPNTAGTNWLLVGSDSRAGLSEEEQMELGTGGDVGAGRTDTIMLLHIPRSGKAQLISIPRDSYVEIPGFGMDKINAAFTYGGPALLGQTIEQWSGLRIDRYAEIGMGGLANVVNSVGGVDICVAEPINDPLAGINLQAGCQNLQGRDALGYVRTRATAMGDLDRVARQREFFAALLDKVTAPTTLINPFRVFSLVNNTAQSFVVGENDHAWNLARVALAMSSGVETRTIPLDGFADTAVGNVMLWNDAETAALWESLK